MTTYVIDYTDPLRDGFSIIPGGFNGPGGSASATTLRLYGRGALEWGESVDEDLLRLTENFNGATPPPYAIGGQFWFQTKFYWLRTGFTWYRLDPDAPGTWTDIGPSGSNSVAGGVLGTNVTPVAPVIGTYWYTGLTPIGLDAFGKPLKATTLYRWDTAFKQVPQGWLERSFSTKTAIPANGVDYPERSLLTWDEFGQTFTPPPISIVSPTQPPGTPQPGTLWWDLTNNVLKVFTGPTGTPPNTWQTIAVVGGSGDATYLRLDGTNTPTANLTMGNFRLMNVGTATVGTDAINRNVGDGRYLQLTGASPMSGNLSLNSLFNVTNLPTQAYLIASNDNAASIRYVNSAITFLGVGAGGVAAISSFANNTTSVLHKPGDIYIDTTTPRAYVSVTTNTTAPSADPAGWKQFWPAQYS